MSDPVQIKQIYRPFCDLFSDAIKQLNVALNTMAPPELRNSGAKSCILHCALALEGVANSLLSNLDYSKRLRQSADRFQPLEKFEFALYHISQNILDHGTFEVQAVAELFQLRNDYVHPKVVTKPGEFSEVSKLLDFKDDGWPTLKIPKESRRWVYEHAKSVVMATDAFLSYYFLNLCSFDCNKAMKILLPVLSTPTGPQFVWVIENHEIFKHAKDGMGIPLSYFDLNREFDDVINDSYGTKKK